MGIIGILLLIIFLASAVLMIGLVLIQEEGGEGLGGIFGGGASAQIGNRSGNVLTRITSILGVLFFISAFGLGWMNQTPESDGVEEAARQATEEQTGLEWWQEEQPTDDDQLDLPSVEPSDNSSP